MSGSLEQEWYELADSGPDVDGSPCKECLDGGEKFLNECWDEGEKCRECLDEGDTCWQECLDESPFKESLDEGENFWHECLDDGEKLWNECLEEVGSCAGWVDADVATGSRTSSSSTQRCDGGRCVMDNEPREECRRCDEGEDFLLSCWLPCAERLGDCSCCGSARLGLLPPRLWDLCAAVVDESGLPRAAVGLDLADELRSACVVVVAVVVVTRGGWRGELALLRGRLGERCCRSTSAAALSWQGLSL